MLVHIERDGGATRIAKEVADMDEVEALREQGHVVHVGGDGAEPAAEAPPVAKPRKPGRGVAG